jgi:hypothetical protein
LKACERRVWKRRSSGKISLRRADTSLRRISFIEGGVFYIFVSATNELQIQFQRSSNVQIQRKNQHPILKNNQQDPDPNPTKNPKSEPHYPNPKTNRIKVETLTKDFSRPVNPGRFFL